MLLNLLAPDAVLQAIKIAVPAYRKKKDVIGIKIGQRLNDKSLNTQTILTIEDKLYVFIFFYVFNILNHTAMKKTFILLLAILFSGALAAQPIFNLGLKAGLNNSKVSLSTDDYSSESILKTHIGAFGRIGWSRMYLQPEVYYSAKGGRVLDRGVNPVARTAQFDFSTVDIPLLVGVKVLKGGPANLRVMGGPVFCLMTSKGIDGGNGLEKQYYKDHYLGYQYGIGVDFLSFFLDARMEHAANRFYYQAPLGIDGKNRTFMLSVGFKIL